VDTHGYVIDSDGKTVEEFNSYVVSVFTMEDIDIVSDSDEIHTLLPNWIASILMKVM